MLQHRPRVVIAGGGVAGLEGLLALRELVGDRAQLTLVSAEESFHYRALGVGEPFGLGQAHRHALAPIARDLGAELVLAAVNGIDTHERHVVTAEGSRLPYDALLLAVGAPARRPRAEGVIVFDRRRGAGAFDGLVGELLAGHVESVAFVVPSGVSWPLPAYELALMTRAWGTGVRPGGVEVSIVSHERTPLGLFGGEASAAVAEVLERAGVRFGAPDAPPRRVVALPELTGPTLPGLPCDPSGFVEVADSFGRVPYAPAVFAVGDCSANPIKQGGLAAQQAAAAAAAIAAIVDPSRPRPPAAARQVLRGLLRTVEGPLYLRAALDDVEATSTASGDPLWWPPSKLAAPRVTSYLRHVERRLAGHGMPFATADARAVGATGP